MSISGISGSFGYGETPQDKAVRDAFNAYMKAYNENSPDEPVLRQHLNDLLAKDQNPQAHNLQNLLIYFDKVNKQIDDLKEWIQDSGQQIQKIENLLKNPNLTPAQKKEVETCLNTLEADQNHMDADLQIGMGTRSNLETQMTDCINQYF